MIQRIFPGKLRASCRMPKNAFVVLFCLLTTVAFSQRTVSIRATVAPTLVRTSYNRQFLYPDSDGQVVEPIFLAGRLGAIGYTAGLTAQYTYAPGWSVAAGLWYSQATLRQTRLTTLGNGTTAISSRTLRIPLLLNYQSSTRRLSPYFSLGLLLDFPMASRVVVTRAGQPTQHLRLATNAGPVFQPMLGAGGRYQVNRRWALIVQPIASYNLGRFGGAQTDNSSYELSILAQLMYSL